MKNQNPRLSITLKPELHAVLMRLSDLTDNSRSSIVADLLEQTLPVFQRMVVVLQATKDVQGALSAEMSASLDHAQSLIEAQLGLALDQIDHSTAPILKVSEDIKRRRKKASTPISNRGVTPVTNAKKPRVNPRKSSSKVVS